jgi:hypothetical protein
MTATLSRDTDTTWLRSPRFDREFRCSTALLTVLVHLEEPFAAGSNSETMLFCRLRQFYRP